MSLEYDPSKIENLAKRLYSSAVATEIIGVLLSLCLIGASWYLPAYYAEYPLKGMDSLLVGLVLTAMVLMFSKSSAESQRGQAQLLLCQLQIERNTAKAPKAAAVEEKEAAPTAPVA